jgi:hypothetical protein
MTPRIVLRDPEDDLAEILERTRSAVLAHPAAAQRLFQAFVAEGRRFAGTEEGRRWREELTGTELIRRARLLCEACGLSAHGDHAGSPSDLVDALALAEGVEGLEPMLASLLDLGGAGAVQDPR